MLESSLNISKVTLNINELASNKKTEIFTQGKKRPKYMLFKRNTIEIERHKEKGGLRKF